MSSISAVYSNDQNARLEIEKNAFSSSDYWSPDKHSFTNNWDKTCYLFKAHLFNITNSESDIVFQDLSTGSCISSNSRLDNRDELIEQLTIDDKNITSSELILKAYQSWGANCLKRMFGEFAFLIWDEEHKKLFAARDHFGVKVLFYNVSHNGCLITNEPSLFVFSNWLKPKIKESWLVKKLSGVVGPQVESPLEGIEILPPAHYLEYSFSGDIKIKRYWDLKEDKSVSELSNDQVLSRFKELFAQSIQSKIQSNYPVSCQLSEGLDSNGIAGFVAKLSQNSIYTFSYNSAKINSSNNVIWKDTYKDIQGMLDMHPNLKPVWTDEKLPSNLEDELIENLKGTVNVLSQFIDHCWLANKKGSRVLLSGWGGDHCVSSNGEFFESELFRSFKWIELYRFLNQRKSRGKLRKVRSKVIELLIKHFSTYRLKKLYVSRLQMKKNLDLAIKNNLVKQTYLQKHKVKEQADEFTFRYKMRYSTKEHARRELFEIGVQKRLIDSELTAKKFKLEYRFPMLDVRLVEFAYSIPSELKVYKGIERYIYREMIKGVTTEKNRLRKKEDVDLPKLKRQLTQKQKDNIDSLIELRVCNKLLNQSKVEKQHIFSLLKYSYLYPYLKYINNNRLYNE